MIIGIDPGKSGAIAWLHDDGTLLEAVDMPDTLGGLVMGMKLSTYTAGELLAVVEEVHSMPGQGVASTFKFGKGYGQILGVLAALNIPTHHVTPQTWKRHHRVGADKTASRQRAGELWPAHADLFKRVKDDGRAEACLIARWYYDTVVRRG